jgi:hypothetical protein
MHCNYDVTGLRRLGYVHALASFDASINNDPDIFADTLSSQPVTGTVFRGHLMLQRAPQCRLSFEMRVRAPTRENYCNSILTSSLCDGLACKHVQL